MSKLRYVIWLGLLLSAFIAPPWGVEQSQAAPVLNPAVDLSKPNFAYSPPLRKFVDTLAPLSLTMGADASNNIGQFLPLATADTTTFPGCDYYEIALVDYHEQMHSDLPPVVGQKVGGTGGTKLRGYVQENNGVMTGVPHYLGPIILASKNRPVRIKFTNRLATGATGNLFIPVDTTLMGAGEGPKLANGADCDPATAVCANYTENRAAIHLHGGIPPWISDGTPHQWITPAGETSPYLKGASQHNVPDMWFDASANVIAACAGQLTCATPGATTTPAGVGTYYWTNQQSGRLMFYHDHALGITRLNVYAGEAAGYLIADASSETPLATAGVPGTIVTNPATGAIVSQDLAHLIPLVIQDKTFVYDNSVTPVGVAKDATTFTAATDPLWDSVNWGTGGNLWFPHVYIPNQDPTSLTGANPLGRWDYGPWFWPVFPVASPYPPTVSTTPEAFMDTPIVNGTAYPYMNVAAAKYRLQILNACNDRMLNLQFYQADSGYTTPATATAIIDASLNVVTQITLTGPGSGYAPFSSPMVHIVGGGGYGAWATATVGAGGFVTAITLTNGGGGYTSAPTVTVGGNTEVKMVPALPDATIPFPPVWLSQTPGMTPDILDSRLSGVPDPRLRGPAMIQIGTEGGVLPGPVVLPNTPVGYEQNKRNIVVLNVLEKTLFLAAAERADVVVDFSQYAGKTLILYNDAPAPVPASDPRYDFYTGNPDYSITGGANYQGGAKPTVPGYGSNTRTIMQFRVAGVDAAPGTPGPVDYYDTALLGNLQTALPAIFKTVVEAPVIPESAYNAIGYTGGSTTDTYFRIQDLSMNYTPYGSTTAIHQNVNNKTIQELFDPQGRMNATLGVELPFTNAGIQTTVPLGYKDPVTDIVLPNGTHLWKITHNGVDTHGVHFHLFNVQVINRVGWDGAIRPPDANELGWKETVRMNPLEDIIVAIRAKVPTYPFSVPDSIRLLDPTTPAGSTFSSFDPITGGPITVTNVMTNFGHEYVWHCHILGHEENDMMRALVLNTDNLLYAGFGAGAANGLQYWDGGAWNVLSAFDASPNMASSGSVLYTGLGTGNGLWRWDNGASTWTRLSTLDPQNMVTSGTVLYAGLGTGNGLWRWDNGASTWTRLSTLDPQNMVTSGTVLYAGLGTGNGLWRWDNGTGAWTKLSGFDPQAMTASGTVLYAGLGTGNGLWRWDNTAGTWAKLNGLSPQAMTASGTVLYAGLGTGNGLWRWDNTAGTWAKLSGLDPQAMTASGSLLYVDFGAGNGLWRWDNTAGTWAKITNEQPLKMVGSGSMFFASLPTSGGIWKWDNGLGTLTQITPKNPGAMVAGY